MPSWPAPVAFGTETAAVWFRQPHAQIGWSIGGVEVRAQGECSQLRVAFACFVRGQVGQCGNQIGCRFWDVALREHAAMNKSGIYDDALSSFFRNETSSTKVFSADTHSPSSCSAQRTKFPL